MKNIFSSTYQDTIKRKLSFLVNLDLSELKDLSDIKKVWKKINKKLYTKEKRRLYNRILDNPSILEIENVLDIITKIKNSLVKKEDIGRIFYHTDMRKFFYEKPLIF